MRRTFSSQHSKIENKNPQMLLVVFTNLEISLYNRLHPLLISTKDAWLYIAQILPFYLIIGMANEKKKVGTCVRENNNAV